MAEQKEIMANQGSVVLLLYAMDCFFFLWGFKWKKWLRWKKIESLLNVSLDTSSKLEHNNIVFFEKKKKSLNLALFSALKGEGGSDNKCHLKIEVSLVSCFQ